VTNPHPLASAADTALRRRAVIRIHEQLIHDLLQLPSDFRVLHVAPGHMGWTIDVGVISPDLPECPEGAIAPELSPAYARVDDRAVLVDTGISRVANARQWEWNYRYPDTGPTQADPITEEQARRAAAHDLSVILLRRQPGETEWTEAPA
jgi:hypothetical protein